MSATPHSQIATAAAHASTTQAASVALPGTRRLPLTLEKYLTTLFWTFAAIGVCGLGYAIEKYVAMRGLGWITDSTYRMFKNPAELPMRIFGLPHFIIGTMFLLSSRRVRSAGRIAHLAGLVVLSVAFCWLFYAYGRVDHPGGGYEFHPVALLAFYFYFLIHGFRDEAFFYKAYGDMPQEAAATHARIMVVLQLLLLGLLAALLIPAYVLYAQLIKPEYRIPALEQIFPASWPYAVRFLTLIVPMALIGALALRHIARAFPDGLRGLWRVHQPMLIVFMIGTGIVLLALASGPWTFNAVVLMHFVGWYLFGRWGLAKRPPKEPPRNTWQWLRMTRAGFTTLHLGLAALVVVLIAISTYAFGKQDALEHVVGSKVFFYWTIVHVTLSFFPR